MNVLVKSFTHSETKSQVFFKNTFLFLWTILDRNCEHLSPFPRLQDSILWRRAEALVLMVIVTTATQELKCFEVTIVTHLIVRLWI